MQIKRKPWDMWPVCVEPVKDTVVHSAGPTLPLMEKTLKPARELFFGGHCLHFLMDIVHPLMDIVQMFDGYCPPFDINCPPSEGKS